jgi:tetrapyrrole methylase family protein/MazG family protein
MKDFEKIVTLTEKLRGKNGFLWDRAQTIESLKNCLMSEAKEVEKAIKAKDYENLKEELGDLLWSIVLISQVAKEEGLFTINSALQIAKEKIIKRHP